MKFGLSKFGLLLSLMAIGLFTIGCGDVADDSGSDTTSDTTTSENSTETGSDEESDEASTEADDSSAANMKSDDSDSSAAVGVAADEPETSDAVAVEDEVVEDDAVEDEATDSAEAQTAAAPTEGEQPQAAGAGEAGPVSETDVAAAPGEIEGSGEEKPEAAAQAEEKTDVAVAPGDALPEAGEAKEETAAESPEALAAAPTVKSEAKPTVLNEGPEAVGTDGATIKNESADGVTTGDWPMWGGDISRNMNNESTNLDFDFDPDGGDDVLWTGALGSQTYGNPTVAGGRVYVGTNNGAGHRPKHPASEDRGILLCFNEKTGDLEWQLTRLKLESGRVNDWPLQGICSSAAVVGDRLYIVTNRCELMCVDVEGFHDGENDGPYQDEVDSEELDADIVWVMDMIGEYGVFPHNLATSSPVIYEDMIYVLTSNGVDEAHLELPSPRSPCFIAVNRNTGELVWENNDPMDQVLHGQWASPAIGVVNGKAQVYFPGGDGILRALDAMTGDEIWRFDLNPKETVWELGGKGSRNAIISTPVFYDNSVILGVGQDPEHGEGVGHLWRIDATKTGDLSAELGEIGSEGEPNPNSGVIWHYGGEDHDGSITGEKDAEVYRRTMSTVAIADGLVIAPDLSGRVHCIDLKTGKRYWEHDLLAELWGSPMIVDGKILLGDEVGDLNIFELSKEENLIKKIPFPSSIYSTPTIANGVMYVSDRSTLYAIKVKGE